MCKTNSKSKNLIWHNASYNKKTSRRKFFIYYDVISQIKAIKMIRKKITERLMDHWFNYAITYILR